MTEHLTDVDQLDADRYRRLREEVINGEPIDIGEAFIQLRVVGNWPKEADFDKAVDALRTSETTGDR